MAEDNSAEYTMPKECEGCGSENIKVRVIYDQGLTRYFCEDCGWSRSLPKEKNLKKRRGNTNNHWASFIVRKYPFCTICGSKESLEAHHIIPVSHCATYAYSCTNGITLCKKCHWLVHNKEMPKTTANGG